MRRPISIQIIMSRAMLSVLMWISLAAAVWGDSADLATLSGMPNNLTDSGPCVGPLDGLRPAALPVVFRGRCLAVEARPRRFGARGLVVRPDKHRPLDRRLEFPLPQRNQTAVGAHFRRFSLANGYHLLHAGYLGRFGLGPRRPGQSDSAGRKWQFIFAVHQFRPAALDQFRLQRLRPHPRIVAVPERRVESPLSAAHALPKPDGEIPHGPPLHERRRRVRLRLAFASAPKRRRLLAVAFHAHVERPVRTGNSAATSRFIPALGRG